MTCQTQSQTDPLSVFCTSSWNRVHEHWKSPFISLELVDIWHTWTPIIILLHTRGWKSTLAKTNQKWWKCFSHSLPLCESEYVIKQQLLVVFFFVCLFCFLFFPSFVDKGCWLVYFTTYTFGQLKSICVGAFQDGSAGIQTHNPSSHTSMLGKQLA